MQKQIGVIGLGKMGKGVAQRLHEQGWDVIVYNRTAEKTKALENEGIKGAYTLKELINELQKPRIIWVMLTAGDATEEVLLGDQGLTTLLTQNDIVIDAANSNYKDTQRRYDLLKEHGLKLMDAGVSGGPDGARNGACIMVGGDEAVFEQMKPLFKALSVEDGFDYFGTSGAGHFVKMVHNGIEYGMMQAIGEGFEVLRTSDYGLDLQKVAKLYNHKSVIESRLIEWLVEGYKKYGAELSEISGVIAHSGEGEWTVQSAKEKGLKLPVIEAALAYRKTSASNENYIGKVVSLLRNIFGGHDVRK